MDKKIFGAPWTLLNIGLVKMTFGLVRANYSMPEWQAVKLTFFGPAQCVFLHFCVLIYFFFPSSCNGWNGAGSCLWVHEDFLPKLFFNTVYRYKVIHITHNPQHVLPSRAFLGRDNLQPCVRDSPRLLLAQFSYWEFWHDITVAILVFQNNEAVAMLCSKKICWKLTSFLLECFPVFQ